MSLKVIAKDIKLTHSVFALPFACAGLFIAETSLPTATQVLLLILCMIFARTFAMSMNRVIDWRIDEKNPRTLGRALPSRQIDVKNYRIWAGVAAIIFVACAFALNSTSGWLSLPLLIILMSYSFMKRISWLTHWYLGLCLGLAPIAAVIALDGHINVSLVLLAGAVTFWTAGFDIIYSLQDEAFDKANHLKSVPAAFGMRPALRISKLCFVVMVVALFSIGFLEARGLVYFMGVIAIGCFLFYEHILISNFAGNRDPAKLNAAFFTMNAYVSIFYLICLQTDFILNNYKG